MRFNLFSNWGCLFVINRQLWLENFRFILERYEKDYLHINMYSFQFFFWLFGSSGKSEKNYFHRCRFGHCATFCSPKIKEGNVCG